MSPSELERVGGSIGNAVQYPPEVGGDYMGMLQVFHQIHCIVSKRRIVFLDFNEDLMF